MQKREVKAEIGYPSSWVLTLATFQDKNLSFLHGPLFFMAESLGL